uniref:L2 protein n=1 Tax=Panagrellus redivivus TaxID=6233 RepID=A0A7E4ZS11_PANRE
MYARNSPHNISTVTLVDTFEEVVRQPRAKFPASTPSPRLYSIVQAPPTPVPYVQDPVDDLLLNDTTTTTTTVEVFRAKVDPNNPVDFFELPPNPHSSDPRPQLVRAAGLPYEVATRTDTRFSDRPTSGIGYVTPIPVYEENQIVHPSRISWIDANTSGPAGYQTTILRRNHNNQHEGRLLSRAGSRPGSPTYSIGPESIAGGRAYSNVDRYTPAPAPLRYTYSQPDIYAASTGGRENYYRHRHNGRRSKSPSSYYDGGRRSRSPGAYYETGRRSRSPAQYYDGELPPMSDLLRRSRSRSETRLDQIGSYNRPLSAMSALSNESFSNSVNNVFKLYETRDCLGNVIARV